MLNLPVEFTKVLRVFAPLFSKRVFAHVQVLVAGAILAPGKRTVTTILRVMGLSKEEHASVLPPRSESSRVVKSRRQSSATTDAGEYLCTSRTPGDGAG
jgi:hypothetical protein